MPIDPSQIRVLGPLSARDEARTKSVQADQGSRRKVPTCQGYRQMLLSADCSNALQPAEALAVLPVAQARGASDTARSGGVQNDRPLASRLTHIDAGRLLRRHSIDT